MMASIILVLLLAGIGFSHGASAAAVEDPLKNGTLETWCYCSRYDPRGKSVTQWQSEHEMIPSEEFVQSFQFKENFNADQSISVSFLKSWALEHTIFRQDFNYSRDPKTGKVTDFPTYIGRQDQQCRGIENLPDHFGCRLSMHWQRPKN